MVKQQRENWEKVVFGVQVKAEIGCRAEWAKLRQTETFAVIQNLMQHLRQEEMQMWEYEMEREVI